MKYVVVHCREVRRSIMIDSDSEENAIEAARLLDTTQTELQRWEVEDNDPGEYEIRE